MKKLIVALSFVFLLGLVTVNAQDKEVKKVPAKTEVTTPKEVKAKAEAKKDIKEATAEKNKTVAKAEAKADAKEATAKKKVIKVKAAAKKEVKEATPVK